MQRTKGEILEYILLREEGPAHDKQFEAAVRLNDNEIGVGKGRSKREAEQQAAKSALELFAEQ